jgi:hypothetical protein
MMKFKITFHIELDEKSLNESGLDPVQLFHEMTSSMERHLMSYYRNEVYMLGSVGGPEDIESGHIIKTPRLVKPTGDTPE